MLDTTDILALHYAEQHQCCWIADPDNCLQCGLWCGHDGQHAPHQIGDYLPPPMLHPVDAFLLRRRARYCPFCQQPSGWTHEASALFLRVDDSARRRPQLEIAWQFHTCGCEAREITVNEVLFTVTVEQDTIPGVEGCAT